MAANQEELKRQSACLRQELKVWEKSFAGAHDGRKAGREEIKQDSIIAAKYKEYSRIRDVLSMKVPPPPPPPDSPPTPSNKRRSKSIPEGTPLKRRRKDVSTPSRGRRSIVYEDKSIHGTPSSFAGTPMKRPFIGPTPQKDGRVLGLFDLLDSPASTATPTKPSTAVVPEARPVLATTAGNRTNVPSTPSKAQRTLGLTDVATPNENVAFTPTSEKKKHSRTPQSIGKRFLLDKFATPSKRKRGQSTTSLTQHDNAAVSNLSLPDAHQADHFSTPAFLRRDSSHFGPLTAVAEEDEADDDDGHEPSMLAQRAASPSTRPPSRKASFHPTRPRFGRTFGRSLSSLMADIQKAESERHDDDLDAMREMEGNDYPAPAPPATRAGPEASKTPTMLDSQWPEAHDTDAHLLGPDGAHATTDDDDDDDNPTTNGRRIYKKKGQKRQTKRVILRPAKKLPHPPESMNDDAPPADAGLKRVGKRKSVTAVQETQLLSDSASDDELNDDGEGSDRRRDSTVYPYPSDAESDAAVSSASGSASCSDDDEEDDASCKKRKTSNNQPATATVSTKNSTLPATNEIRSSNLEIVRKAARKVNAAAHSNFRRLKIRSSKGAAGGGAKGRFGRRR